MPHIHQVQLPDGTVIETGIDEEISVGTPAASMADELELPKGLKAVPPDVDRDTFERCVEKVMDQGHDKSSAFAICTAGGAGTKREFVRDETGRFSSEGAGGAANSALEAGNLARAAAGTKDPKEAEARRRQVAGLVDQAAARARETLGREHPAVRQLSSLSDQVRRADARGLQTAATQLDKVNERLAAEAASGKARFKGESMNELEQAKQAYQERDAAKLPEYGRSVYDSMYRSTFQMFGKADDPASERYATGIAWRAVAQAYKLGEKRAAQSFKGIPASQLADVEGGFYIVPISKFRGAESFYDRTEFREIPDSGGALVHVGIGRPQNHKNVIDVRVPKRVVDSTPGGSGAISWVQNNWAYIFNIAKADISPGGMIRNAIVKQHSVPRARIRLEGCKFVTDPAKAADRITYDVVYPAWQVDLQGQYATAEEVRKMAHDFMANAGGTNLMHITGLKMTDGKPAGVPVESFIAGPGDPNFPRDAWVMGVKWHPEAWEKIKSGELRGYSIEGQWGVIPLHAGA